MTAPTHTKRGAKPGIQLYGWDSRTGNLEWSHRVGPGGARFETPS